MHKPEHQDGSGTKAVIALLLGLILAFLMPALLTGKILDWHLISFSDTGEIGDTIGGIAGPILNFTGLILVYLSFKQQFEANELQREALKREIKTGSDNREFSRATNLIKEVKEELSMLKFKTLTIYNGEPLETELTGTDALVRFSEYFENEERKSYYIKDPRGELFLLNEFYNIAMLLELLIERVRDYPFEPGDERILKHQIKNYYVNKHFPFMTPLKEAINRKKDPSKEYKQAFMVDLVNILNHIDELAQKHLYDYQLPPA